MPIAEPSSSPIIRLDHINKHFSTTSRMSQTNNADFELQNLFSVKGKVSSDKFITSLQEESNLVINIRSLSSPEAAVV